MKAKYALTAMVVLTMVGLALMPTVAAGVSTQDSACNRSLLGQEFGVYYEIGNERHVHACAKGGTFDSIVRLTPHDDTHAD